MPTYSQRGLMNPDRLGRETVAPEVLATDVLISLRQIQASVLLTGCRSSLLWCRVPVWSVVEFISQEQ